MTEPSADAFREALARAGIRLPPRDFEAALRTARFLSEAARIVGDHLARTDPDAPGR